MTMRVRGLYAILDVPHPHGLDARALVEAFALGGAALVQLRAKHHDHAQRLSTLSAIADVCCDHGLPLIVDDDLRAAEAGIPGVRGVHLGQGDLHELGPDPAGRILELRERGIAVGLSTHSLAQLDAALALGPAYVGFGPVYATGTKLDAEPVVGVERLAAACARADVPVVAIGGISLARIPAVCEAGAAAIAMIGGLVAATPEQTRERCRDVASRIAMTRAS